MNRKTAPLGSYAKLGFSVHDMHLEGKQELRSKGKAKTFDAIDFSPNLALGNNWIFGDFLILGFDFSATIPIKTIYNMGFEGVFNTNYNNYVYKHLFMAEIVKLSLNLGWIAF